MGAEYQQVMVIAKDLQEVEDKYESLLNDLLWLKSKEEAEYLLSNRDENGLCFRSGTPFDEAIELHDNGNDKSHEEEASDMIAEHLFNTNDECLFMYTGSFLSASDGLDFIEKDGQIAEFSSEEEATDYIEEHHQKWDCPMVAKIANSDKWLIGAWCSS